MNTINFEKLVNTAIMEIKYAVENGQGWNFYEDFIKDCNWSEICQWCKFPDLGTNESIYEKAINIAILILAHNYVDNYKIKEYIKELEEDYDTQSIG